MRNLEENYISVVAVVQNLEILIEDKIKAILQVLAANFKYYELIVVDNMSEDKTYHVMREMKEKFTCVQLPIRHDSQSALSAGVNIAIGDYVVEIENLTLDIPYEKIMELYRKCQEGNDFVFLTPEKTSFSSRVFYKILNGQLKNLFLTNIGSSVMTLSSRRGQNKTAEVGRKLVNRNVSYVLTGLQTASLPLSVNYSNKRGFKQNFELMSQTLLYYTDFVTGLAQNIAGFFFLVSCFFILYSFYMKFTMETAPGWASTVIIMSIGFSGVFLMFGLLARYLDNILKGTMKTKGYIYRSIDKK